MSEGSTPSVSIPDLATALRGAITEAQSLTLDASALGDSESAQHLLRCLDVGALTLAVARVEDVDGGLTVGGRASFLSLADLDVTLTVTAPPGGVRLSLTATPPAALTLQLPGFPWLTIRPSRVAVDVERTASTQSITGAITGAITLDGIEVQITIHLPSSEQGFRITGVISGEARPGPLALAGPIGALDLLSSLPSGLGELLTVREFELTTGARPTLSFTLVSGSALELVPGTLAIESAELRCEVLPPAGGRPLAFRAQTRAVLRVGAIALPIQLGKDASSGEWSLRMEGAAVPLPGLGALAQLFGGAEQLASAVPGFDGIGALNLTSFEVCVDPGRRSISSLAFAAAAQDEWTLPLFGEVSFGRPTLSLSLSGLGAAAGQTPYLAVRLVSARTWELVPGELTLDGVELFVGVLLATSSSPRSVTTRLEAGLQVGGLHVPLSLTTDSSAGAWVMRLNSACLLFPDLSNIAQLFGGAALLDSLPGFGSIGALALTSLELRIASATRKVSSLAITLVAEKEWKLPALGDAGLQYATLELAIANPFHPASRALTGRAGAVVELGGLAFNIEARKDSPAAPWRFTGRQVVERQLSLTALAGALLPDPLPPGMPEIAFVDFELSLIPSTGEFTLSGRSADPWSVPLGATELSLSNVGLALLRSPTTLPQTKIRISGDLAIGGVSTSLALEQPGAFKISADLPQVKLAEMLTALGAGAVLDGLGVPPSLFSASFGPCTLSLDVSKKTASLRGTASGFRLFEIQVRRDSHGKMGVAMALQPSAGAELKAVLDIPGIETFPLSTLTFVLSSLHDPELEFETPAFKQLGPIARGFGFSARIDLQSLGGSPIPGLPTSPIAVQARFGSSLSQFTVAAALPAQGGRLLLDQASDLWLIDPELRFSPAEAGFAVGGKLRVILDSQPFEFAGALKVKPGAVELAAAMKGDWENPFGISKHVVARDLAIAFNLPLPAPSLGGTLQVGRTTGKLLVKPHPTEPVLNMQVENIDLHDLITSLCEPVLAGVPAEYRQTLADIRIANAELYIAPRDTTFGANNIPCPAGLKLAGTLYAWGLVIDGYVRTTGTGPLRALKAEGLIRQDQGWGGLLELKGGRDENGALRSGPYFKLDLTPGTPPVVVIAAGIKVLGSEGPSVDIILNDAGFRALFSSTLLGGAVGATFELSGGRLGPSAKYSLAVTLDGSAITELLGTTRATIKNGIGDAKAALSTARALLKSVEDRGLQLAAEMEAKRREVQAERDRDMNRLRQAQSDLQRQRAALDALQRELDAARATVRAERAEVERKVAAAQRDVDAAKAAVSSLNNEINATDRAFHRLPKIDVPWKPSQAREGTWFGIKMGGLYAARETATGTLTVASRILASFLAAQQSFSIDLDPRVAAILGSYNVAQVSLASTQQLIRTLEDAVNLIPIDADFRLVTLRGLQEAQTVQLVAAKAAFALAEKTLDGIATLADSFDLDVTINKASFAGELGFLSGGKVRLELGVTVGSQVRTFTVGYELNKPLSAIVEEIVGCILGKSPKAAIDSVTQSTTTAQQTIRDAEYEVLPTSSIVNLKYRPTGQLVRVIGKKPLRFGDPVSFQTSRNYYMVAEGDGVTVNANRTAIGPWEVWVLLNPNDLSSQDFVRYGDQVCLRSHLNRYMVAEDNTGINANRTAVGPWERFTLVLASDPSRRDEVDLTQKIALISRHNNPVGAWTSGGGTLYNHHPVLGDAESWTLIDHNNWSSLEYSLVVRGNDTSDPACQFRVKRSGDWLGFESVRRERHLFLNDGKAAFGGSELFNAERAWEHFRLENNALYNERTQSYLRFIGGAANAPQFVDGGGSTRTDPACSFEFVAYVPSSSAGSNAILVAGAVAPPEPPAAPRGPTENDLLAATGQKNEILSGSAAQSGPGAQSSATAQATQLRTAGEDRVAALQLVLAQAEADRRARRQRLIEKAARGPREALSDFRDSALRFDGQSYLEAPAIRNTTRRLTAAEAFRELPVDAVVTLRSRTDGQLLRVIGERPLRFGDRVSLRTYDGSHYLLTSWDGSVSAAATSITDMAQFVVSKPGDHTNRDFICYGDEIDLFGHNGRYLAAEEDGTVTIRRQDVRNPSRFILLLASDPASREEVDLSQPIALRSSRQTFLNATNGGGSAVAANATVLNIWETWTLIGPDRSAEARCLVPRGTDPSDPACRFLIKGSGDSRGLLSVRWNLHLSASGDAAVRATAPSLDATTASGTRFAIGPLGELNQGAGRFMRFVPRTDTVPPRVDCLGEQTPTAYSAMELVAMQYGLVVRELVRVEPRPIIELGTRFTIDAWIHPEALGGSQQVIVSKWEHSEESELILWLNAEGRLGLGWHVAGASSFGTPVWTSCLSSERVKLNAWSHVAAVRDGDTVSLYIDGRRVGGAQGLGHAPLRAGTALWRIAALIPGSDPQYFQGLLDSIRIWSTAHSAASLRALRYVVSRGDEEDLVACWNLDEQGGETAFDASRQELHARLHGSVRRASPGAPEGPPMPDRHLTLSGSAHALLGNVDLFGGSPEMAIESWVRIDSLGEDFTAILSRWAQGDNDSFLFGIMQSGKLAFAWRTQGSTAYGTPGWNHVVSEGSVPRGRWCHVAVVRQRAAIRFYRDGEPIGASDSASDQPLRPGTAPVHIGSERGALRFFTGSIAELRVWDRAVSADEVRDNRQRSLVGDESGLRGLWRCDEGWSAGVRDATAGAHHGTLTGPVSWPARGGPPGRSGPVRGMKFSGAQYVEFGDADEFSPSVALTIEGWINLDALTGDLVSIVSKWRQQPAADEYMFGLSSGRKLAFAWHTTGSNTFGTRGYSIVLSTGTIEQGRWTHVAVVRAGQSVTFYVDGVSAGSADVCDDEPFVNTPATLRIGAEGPSRFVEGSLAGLRIWRTARTQEQLCEAMSGLVSSRAPGRILDLRFDEGEGSAVRDAASPRLGQCNGQPLPAFVPVTLPVRVPAPISTDPSEVWLQSALDVARHHRSSGIEITAAIPEVEAALAPIERVSHPRILALLAKAGYAPSLLGQTAVRTWGHSAADVAQQLCDADRPAQEALLAIDAALAESVPAGSSQVEVLALASAAGYLPEELGPALGEVWGHDARAVASLARDAQLGTLNAARTIWVALSRESTPCFPALVELLLTTGHAGSGVRKALQEHFGLDASSIEQAALRANVALDSVPDKDCYLFDAKHRLCLVAGDTYDQHVYHQAPGGRPNALWRLTRLSGGGFQIRDRKHGKSLVAGDVYDGNVYHQEPQDRLNARWNLVQSVDANGFETFWLVDQKHGCALVAGDAADNNLYHQSPRSRENARMSLFAVDGADVLREVQTEISIFTPAYRFSIRSAADAAVAGWRQEYVGFLAYDAPRPGTVPIHLETPLASPGSHFHLSQRSAEEAAQLGWLQQGVAFHAFAWQVPGTVPVYRETANGKFFFSPRPRAVAELCGWEQQDVAFYAYLADMLTPPRSISLRVYSGQYVHLDTDNTTIVARNTAVGGWESFSVIELGHGRVALRARNGRYVTAENGGGGRLLATADAIGRNEAFLLSDIGSGSIALQAQDGQYVSSDANEGNVPLRANRSARVGLESLALVNQPSTFFSFSPIEGNLAQVSVAADGTVWGVTAANAIYRFRGPDWEYIGGALAQISVGSVNHIWGVNASGMIYRWKSGNWELIPGTLRQVSVAADGTAWGVTASHVIYRWRGPDWEHIGGALVQISVGSVNHIWGVNSSGMIYRWLGTNWEQIPGTMKSVSVASDGTVLGITPTNGVCLWRGGDRWEHLPVNLKQAAVGSAEVLWGIASGDTILRGVH